MHAASARDQVEFGGKVNHSRPDHAVALDGLCFRWARRQPLVLDIPAFRIETGERVYLKGPSGSGKTTLLNLLGGIGLPEQGRVEVLGTDLAGLSGSARDAFRADHIGFIFQMFNLVPYLTAIENVLLPCRFSMTRRNRVLRNGSSLESEAQRLLTHMELHEDALTGRNVTELSVGQQQRVAAARALIGGPALVIADEPTSALDTETRLRFLELVFQEVETNGATLLFVSHDPTLEPAFQRTVSLPEINRATGVPS
jgi:putative ABC transport system ATP-binding protein